jgi:hypothetical protein
LALALVVGGPRRLLGGLHSEPPIFPGREHDQISCKSQRINTPARGWFRVSRAYSPAGAVARQAAQRAFPHPWSRPPKALPRLGLRRQRAVSGTGTHSPASR